jgi:hypothetical protein
MDIRTFHRLMFIIVPVFMVIAIIVNVALYKECKSDGYSTFACVAMLNKGQYIMVDMVDGKP